MHSVVAGYKLHPSADRRLRTAGLRTPGQSYKLLFPVQIRVHHARPRASVIEQSLHPQHILIFNKNMHKAIH